MYKEMLVISLGMLMLSNLSYAEDQMNIIDNKLGGLKV